MTFELSAEDAALVHEFVVGRLVDLKKEINRTENVTFREELKDPTGAGAADHSVDAEWA